MSFHARVEAVAVIDVFSSKLNVEDINKIGIGKPPVSYILLQHVSEYRVINIPNLRMEFFSTNAIRTVIRMNIIGIQVRIITSAVIVRIR